MTTALMGRHAMIAVPSPVNLCALTIIPPASLYMTLAHEYASREPNPEPKPQTQTPNPKPKPQTRTRTRTRTQTRSPNRSPNRPHRISSALGMGAEGSSARGKGGMNPSKGEGCIPRCSLYLLRRQSVCTGLQSLTRGILSRQDRDVGSCIDTGAP